MTFLLDDDWDNEPRVVRAGTAAFGLYSRCGMWVARHLTDGFVPEEVAAAYGSREWAAKLTAVGLWEAVEGGYLMPDYLVRNPDRATVEKRREQYAERQRRWRERQTRQSRGSNASRNAAPTPSSKEERRAPASPGGARASPPAAAEREPDNPDWRRMPAFGAERDPRDAERTKRGAAAAREALQARLTAGETEES